VLKDNPAIAFKVLVEGDSVMGVMEKFGQSTLAALERCATNVPAVAIAGAAGQNAEAVVLDLVNLNDIANKIKCLTKSLTICAHVCAHNGHDRSVVAPQVRAC
jgi:hypothetical protein